MGERDGNHERENDEKLWEDSDRKKTLMLSKTQGEKEGGVGQMRRKKKSKKKLLHGI